MKPKFAFHEKPEGGVDYIGEIVGESADTIRMHVLDAFMATGCGLWCLSDEVRDVSRSGCRIFTDKITCLETALQINQRIYCRKTPR